MGYNPQDKSFKIGNQVLHEQDLEFPVEYNGQTFYMKYPTPPLKAAMESEIARRLNGYPRSSFDADHLAWVEAMVYVDTLVVKEKSPPWWDGAWNCLDEEAIVTLYNGYYSFRSQLRERLRKGEFQTSGQSE
jgi:hypothetical protein